MQQGLEVHLKNEAKTLIRTNKYMKVNFTYVRDEVKQPIICIAFEENDNSVSFQYAVKHPKDRPNKSIARQVALGRLEKYPLKLDVYGLSRHDVRKKIIQDIEENFCGSLQRVCRKALKRME